MKQDDTLYERTAKQTRQMLDQQDLFKVETSDDSETSNEVREKHLEEVRRTGKTRYLTIKSLCDKKGIPCTLVFDDNDNGN